jgi:hypothetical protein
VAGKARIGFEYGWCPKEEVVITANRRGDSVLCEVYMLDSGGTDAIRCALERLDDESTMVLAAPFIGGESNKVKRRKIRNTRMRWLLAEMGIQNGAPMDLRACQKAWKAVSDKQITENDLGDAYLDKGSDDDVLPTSHGSHMKPRNSKASASASAKTTTPNKQKQSNVADMRTSHEPAAKKRKTKHQ